MLNFVAHKRKQKYILQGEKMIHAESLRLGKEKNKHQKRNVLLSSILPFSPLNPNWSRQVTAHSESGSEGSSC